MSLTTKTVEFLIFIKILCYGASEFLVTVKYTSNHKVECRSQEMLLPYKENNNH